MNPLVLISVLRGVHVCHHSSQILLNARTVGASQWERSSRKQSITSRNHIHCLRGQSLSPCHSICWLSQDIYAGSSLPGIHFGTLTCLHIHHNQKPRKNKVVLLVIVIVNNDFQVITSSERKIKILLIHNYYMDRILTDLFL